MKFNRKERKERGEIKRLGDIRNFSSLRSLCSLRLKNKTKNLVVKLSIS